MQTHAVMFGAFEVSRTRVGRRLVATFAFDLRGVAWQRGDVAGASARLLPLPGDVTDPILLNGEGDGSAYADPARRDLERAAGGFFLIDAEICEHDQSAPAAVPRIVTLTVRARDAGAIKLSARVAA